MYFMNQDSPGLSTPSTRPINFHNGSIQSSKSNSHKFFTKTGTAHATRTTDVEGARLFVILVVLILLFAATVSLIAYWRKAGYAFALRLWPPKCPSACTRFFSRISVSTSAFMSSTFGRCSKDREQIIGSNNEGDNPYGIGGWSRGDSSTNARRRSISTSEPVDSQDLRVIAESAKQMTAMAMAVTQMNERSMKTSLGLDDELDHHQSHEESADFSNVFYDATDEESRNRRGKNPAEEENAYEEIQIKAKPRNLKGK